MKRVWMARVALVCLIACGQLHAAHAGTGQQDPLAIDGDTATRIQYMYDQEKLALDLNWEFLGMWDDPLFQSLGALERGQMGDLFSVMQAYGLEPLVATGTQGEYGHHDHTQAYSRLHSQGSASLLEAYQAIAYLEEWDIMELNLRLYSVTELQLAYSYGRMLRGAEDHLREVLTEGGWLK